MRFYLQIDSFLEYLAPCVMVNSFLLDRPHGPSVWIAYWDRFGTLSAFLQIGESYILVFFHMRHITQKLTRANTVKNTTITTSTTIAAAAARVTLGVNINLFT